MKRVSLKALLLIADLNRILKGVFTCQKDGIKLPGKKFIYFVSLSSNVPFVLKKAIEMANKQNEVSIFFDLDGARVLDKRYLKKMEKTTCTNLSSLMHLALDAGIKLYGCQLNVLIADGLELIEGAELAGVATFLSLAYQADAVLSY